MRIAFKEWAVIVDALVRGEQILILRKGGIHEGRGGFQVEHPAFLLFPTRYHQQREGVVPAAQARFDSADLLGGDPGVVTIPGVCEVACWWRVEELETARKLSPFHVWRDEVIADRFQWGREANIHAMALRVHRLSTPMTLPIVPAYGGCKSWIELESEVSTTAAEPVLPTAVFEQRLGAMEAVLGAGRRVG